MLTAHAFTPDNLLKSMKEGAACLSAQGRNLPGSLNSWRNYLRPKGKACHLGRHGRIDFRPSYFSTRFGAAWKSADKEFLNQLKEILRQRSSSTK